MPGILARCPVCGGNMYVAELHCPQCQTSVRGNFDTCRFCRLPIEQLRFIETFLRCEGNLSRVERELGISYPTVRNRLQNALMALGLQEETPMLPQRTTTNMLLEESVRARRREILEAVANGDMDAQEAAEALQQIL